MFFKKRLYNERLSDLKDYMLDFGCQCPGSSVGQIISLCCKAPRTGGAMTQGHVAGRCCSDKIMCCSHIGDM